MTNFLKQTFASLIGSLLGLTIFSGISTLGLLFLIIVATSSKDTGPEVKDKSMLVFDLSMKITDSQPSSSDLLQTTLTGVDEDRITLRKVIETLEKAQKDPRIVGIYIDATKSGAASGLGYASLKEIRQALDKFRGSGKKIVAYGTDWNEREYYLSSVANNIVLNPVGLMEINGLSSQPMFLTGALQKYGIGVQVVRVGKFKGAVEPFILNKLSPENRQQTQKLLDDVWGEWRTSVGTSRKMQPQKLQAIADSQAILEANTAKSNGLVDQIAYLDEVVTDLKKLTASDKDDKSFRQINISDYAEVPGKSMGVERNSENKIAIVYAEGEIVDGKGENGEIGGDNFAQIFNKIRQDQDVKSVVLRINSPGGSATASEVIQREIKLTRQVKPVIVSMGDIAASGGYWIASDSNRIFAEPNTITGSIGVFGVLFNGEKLADNNGITWDTVKTAKYADNQTVSRPKSPQELALYQRSVNRIYNMFISKVAQGRKLPQQKVAEIAQGRVWSGAAAKQIGLVDEIGGLNVAIEYAAKAAKLGNNWELQEYPRATTLEERFFGRKLQEAQAKLGIEKTQIKSANPLLAEFEKLQQEISILNKMNDPQGIYARLPFNLKID
ncbi:signal peptide peptidase SppA [Anabaena cylindrica FACHB-243]|uniref:Protease 4 n=1 Tax=Anabaena cylindrica (strain ATCC 27899 / PCC 7122) TaxID=272123 RepID=K9ZNS8_ANACC|nr:MULTISPECIES: signal peptide peptidase SppA [Anabaena]AFZ59985.1 signal peptide peptidase SppA, 67K type [Anabaena cylindrica PCC 7122]MBD2417957.1 signal peptide peptidase SppA [Anabaena cylindrica FACHB-243]MBY5281779.1 signal peptide peptidase SppA [Anabaena sp. CCAP 1446/1C]MBY5307037.1 signal peptide peptidase SppA [Anabaena sp. CCAP 1446/1C]MCM2404873.1 signal peptide peptidase SppA [Anabaena sp. CCAP 1446/1C]